MNYKDQLKTPEWKAKRLEILERDSYCCVKCSCKKGLQIHHNYYEDGKLAWEYPNKALTTLCKSCHKLFHDSHTLSKTRDFAPNKEFFLVFQELMNVWERWNLSTSDLNLFGYLCNRYSNGSEFTITANIRNEIAELTDRKPTTFNNSTRALLDKKLIIKISPRSYKLNPRYIFKGSSKKRNKALIEILSIDKNA